MLPAWCAQWSPLAIWGWQGDLRPVVGKPRAFWPGSQGRAFGAVHIGPAEGSRLEESAWAVCMQDFPLAGLPRLVCFLVGGVPAPRSDLGGQHGVDVSEVDAAAQQSHVARTDEMRLARLRGASPHACQCLSLDRGHVANHDCAVSCRVDDGAARARSLRFDLCVLGVSLVPAMALIVLHGVFFEVQARYAFPVWVLPLFS